ncbi:hypothetical protein [Azonexus sp.]|nr:hypothetical protein [Azonexus sp.]
MEQTTHQEEIKMIEMNIKEFLAAARSYLLDLLPAQQPQLVVAPVHQAH